MANINTVKTWLIDRRIFVLAKSLIYATVVTKFFSFLTLTNNSVSFVDFSLIHDMTGI